MLVLLILKLSNQAVGCYAKKCLEKQFRGTLLGNRFSVVQFIENRCLITTKSSQAKNLPNTEKMGDQ
jgi:hypothetical protein